MNPLMNPLLEKLGVMEREVAAEKGAFRFFALFLREESPGKWDLLVSAPWLEANRADGISYLAKQLRARLDIQELLTISRLAFIGEHTPGLQPILQAVHIQHGCVEMGSSNYFGLDIKHAYVITADKEQVADYPADLIQTL